MNKFWTFLAFFVSALCLYDAISIWVTGEGQTIVEQISNNFILFLLFLGHGVDRLFKGKVIEIGNRK